MISSKNNWSSIFISPKKVGKLFFILFCLGLSSFLGTQIPIKLKLLFENFSDQEQMVKHLTFLFGLFFSEFVIEILYQRLVVFYVKEVILSIRTSLFNKWINFLEGMSHERKVSDEFPLGEVLARLMGDTEAIRELISTGSFTIVLDFVFVISCLLSFLKLDLSLGGTLIFVEGLALFGLIYLTKIMSKTYLQVRVESGLLSRSVADVIGGLSFSFYNNAKNYGSKKMTKNLDSFLNIQLKSNIWEAGHYSLAESLYSFMLAVFALFLSLVKEAQVSTLSVMMDLTQRSISPIKQMASKISNFQRAMTGIVRLKQFWSHLQQEGDEEKVLHQFNNQQIKKFSFQVEEFIYPQKSKETHFRLHDVTFFAKAPALLGIVGPSGHGKSTILGLMAGNLPLTQGQIEIELTSGEKIIFNGLDGKKGREYRHFVGLVTQDSHVFTASYAFNLSFEFQISKELKVFWDDVKLQIPYLNQARFQLENEIIPQNLSLGEKQLLCALRAIYLKKPIILFDEISSGLDSQLEEALREAVLLAQQNSLTFIVTHRLETVLKADEILIVHQGTIVERGKHQNLIEESDIYRKFVDEISSLSYNS